MQRRGRSAVLCALRPSSATQRHDGGLSGLWPAAMPNLRCLNALDVEIRKAGLVRTKNVITKQEFP